MIITEHCPVPQAQADALHAGLAAAGQALRAEEMPEFLIAAEEDGALIGACKGEIAFQTAHVSELWVDTAARGRGLGATLLDRAEAHAVARGCTRLHLETRNPKAVPFYTRAGYAVFGELPDYEGDKSLYYLVKTLGASTQKE